MVPCLIKNVTPRALLIIRREDMEGSVGRSPALARSTDLLQDLEGAHRRRVAGALARVCSFCVAVNDLRQIRFVGFGRAFLGLSKSFAKFVSKFGDPSDGRKFLEIWAGLGFRSILRK